MKKLVNKAISGVSYNMIVGGVIRAFREDHGLNQVQLADLLSMPASTLSRIEKGSYSCSVEQLALIARVLEAKPSKMMERIENSVKLASSQGLRVSVSKQEDNSALYLLGTAAVAALVMAARKP